MQGRRDTTTRTRIVAALGFSLSCHAAALVALTLLPWSARSPFADRAIVVRVVGDPGGLGEGSGPDDASGPDDGGSEASTPASEAAVPAAPPIAARPAGRNALPHEHRRARRTESRAVEAPPGADAGDGATRFALRDDARADASAYAAANVDAGIDAAFANGLDAGGATAGRATAGGARASGATGVGGRAGGGGLGGDGGADLRARCSVCPTPEYPARARRQGWQGTVDVELRVGRDGAVEQASIGRSSGFAVLDAAAVIVARRSRFRVAERAEIHGQLRYRFVLEGAHDRPL